MGVSFQADNHLPGGCGTAPKCNIVMVAAPQRKVASMMDPPPVPFPGALSIGDGGGKEEGRLLGCGLEKRPPYPRLTELAYAAPPFRVGSFTQFISITGKGGA
jgi:hypothetical protein